MALLGFDCPELGTIKIEEGRFYTNETGALAVFTALTYDFGTNRKKITVKTDFKDGVFHAPSIRKNVRASLMYDLDEKCASLNGNWRLAQSDFAQVRALLSVED